MKENIVYGINEESKRNIYIKRELFDDADNMH
jgi:hypothetical protein